MCQTNKLSLQIYFALIQQLEIYVHSDNTASIKLPVTYTYVFKTKYFKSPAVLQSNESSRQTYIGWTEKQTIGQRLKPLELLSEPKTSTT